MEPEFKFSFSESEETLDPILDKLVAARDRGLERAVEELRKFDEDPSTTLWEKVKEKHMKCTLLDLEFMELFECLRDKLVVNSSYRLESSKDPAKLAKRERMRIRVTQMDRDKIEYSAQLASVRIKYDRKVVEVLVNTKKRKNDEKGGLGTREVQPQSFK